MDIEAEIAAYFINNTKVDDPYTLTEYEELVYSRKELIFNKLTEHFTYTQAKEASKQERMETDQMRVQSLTYGEIEFRSFAELFYTIESRYGGLPQGGIFYDLGSGSGKGILAAALLGNFQECKGIEILDSLHNLCEKLISEYEDKFTQFVISNHDMWTVIPKLKSIKGDIMKVDWTDARMIFVNSTCFDEEMIMEISEIPVAVGTFAISLTKALSANSWVQLETVRRKMSWGHATVYIQRKVDPEEQKKLMIEFGRALDS
ncbi:hypothetical protein SteCoe_186 [Stentor coeruleus]|uniref:Histone-lysine N-methyltransferase, H3 lysine-79 specific n=1 Tax=Stentor coeruleus TaxID=5963 RepID=A0A1R2D4V0_9CILI|nr:hypothetical protein SteCoe_186 [Stentor coeruleus]